MVPPDGFAGQTVPVGQGSTYVLSGWGMLVSGTSPVQIGAEYRDAQGIRHEELEPSPFRLSTAGFSFGSIEFTVPAGITQVDVYVWNPGAAGVGYADDLRLERKNDGTPDSPPESAISCRKLLFPSYSDPANGVWSQAVSTGSALSIIIINSDSGVGPHRKPEFDAPLAQARKAGVLVAGYILTGYGKRSVGSVEAEMDLYYQWYGIKSFFFDEGEVSPDSLSLYRTLAAATHQRGGLMIINFGWAPAEAYMSFTDIAVIFESPASYFLSDSYQPPTWVHDYPASRIAQIIHTTPQSSLAAVLAKSNASNAGFVWITDQLGDSIGPYQALPSYWATLNQTLDSTCPGP